MGKDRTKNRVKCANCGMIYDIILFEGSWDGDCKENMRGECPKCGSNAFDVINPENILRYL